MRVRLMDDRQCLRLDRVASLVGVKPRTIRSWVKRGKFPKPIKPTPGLVLWIWSEVGAWIDAKKAERRP